MDVQALLIFAATALPLVCTPGPDILFIASQGMSGGRGAALKANAGVLGGYLAHGLLAAVGVAGIVAASPLLFELMRWFGVAYLLYLAARMIASALRPGTLVMDRTPAAALVARGFLTSFLNPKGLLLYFSVLPQFIDPAGAVVLQAAALSATFVALCAIVYGTVGLVAASAGRTGGFSDRRRRVVEGASGGLLIVAAGRMASA